MNVSEGFIIIMELYTFFTTDVLRMLNSTRLSVKVMISEKKIVKNSEKLKVL